MPLVSVSTWFVEKNKMNIAGILILKKKGNGIINSNVSSLNISKK